MSHGLRLCVEMPLPVVQGALRRRGPFRRRLSIRTAGSSSRCNYDDALLIHKEQRFYSCDALRARFLMRYHTPNGLHFESMPAAPVLREQGSQRSVSASARTRIPEEGSGTRRQPRSFSPPASISSKRVRHQRRCLYPRRPAGTIFLRGGKHPFRQSCGARASFRILPVPGTPCSMRPRPCARPSKGTAALEQVRLPPTSPESSHPRRCSASNLAGEKRENGEALRHSSPQEPTLLVRLRQVSVRLLCRLFPQHDQVIVKPWRRGRVLMTQP